MNKFKGIAMVQLQEGSTVLLWHDMWNNSVRVLHSAELFSYTTQSNMSVHKAKELENLHEIFQLPLSDVAFQQYLALNEELENLPQTQNKDVWTYIWGTAQFSVSKAYKALTGHTPTHPVFNWLWKSKCQPKHKIFFWLLLQDKLNTRDRLRRRHMSLESYTCENCILQKMETVYHLFLRCSFAKNCWASIGIFPPRISCPQRAINRIMKQLSVSGAMEIIILMAWSIWKCRNGWIFKSIPPTVQRCRSFLTQELQWLQFRTTPALAQSFSSWMELVHL
jgi:hypothetical protein